MYGHSMVEFNGDVYTFGGSPSHFNAQSTIFRLSCTNLNCIWTTIKQKMKVARRFAVAIPVEESLLNLLELSFFT